LLLEAKPKLV